MAQKRRNGESSDDMTGREKKKLKMTAARTIAVQSISQAGPFQSAVAGPSTSKATGGGFLKLLLQRSLI